MNCPIKVLVIDSILIVPNPSRWVCHFVTEHSKAVDARFGFDLVGGRGCPG